MTANPPGTGAAEPRPVGCPRPRARHDRERPLLRRRRVPRPAARPSTAPNASWPETSPAGTCCTCRCHFRHGHLQLGSARCHRHRRRLLPNAVARARDLAERAGLAADFVEADTQALPASLYGRFDLVGPPTGCCAGSATSAPG
ncbi:class I SAM-dependent methyltransferase [Yinghuangia aomiensis]